MKAGCGEVGAKNNEGKLGEDKQQGGGAERRDAVPLLSATHPKT